MPPDVKSYTLFDSFILRAMLTIIRHMQLAVHPVHPEYDSPVSCEGENVTAEGLEGHMMYDRSRMFCGSKHRNSPSSFATWEGDETVFVADIVTELWY